MKIRKPFFILLSSSMLVACSGDASKTANTAEKTTAKKGVDLTAMDTTANPCDDFFQFASGTWVKENPVPETEGKWTAFNIVDDNNNKILRKILEDAAAVTDAEKGSNTQKIGDFYATVMDSTKRDQEGIAPIQGEIDKINAISDIKQLGELMAYHHSIGLRPAFGFGIEQDLKNNEVHASYLSQGGLGLPDRDYYFNEDPTSVMLRTKYQEQINALMTKAGLEGDFASPVMKIETGLAEKSMNSVEQRDYEKQYNKRSLAQVKEMTPNFDWDGYFKVIGITPDTIIVGQLEFFAQFNNMLSSISLDDWKKYLHWNLLNATASKLSTELEEQDFEFYGKLLRGQQKMQPRWKRALKASNRYLDQIVGKEFVKQAFSEDAKQHLNGMLDNIMLVLDERIKALNWMSQDSKNEAIRKLNAIGRKLGYPDVWKDYSGLEIARDSYVQNHFRVMRFRFQDNIDKLGKPIDKTEWGMPPQMVNAYYHPLLNEVVFPAGILQPPFMDPEADDAVLYATIGAVIGHEITHGFDDSGARFNADGEMKNWWQENDLTNFQALGQKVINHYEKFEPIEGMPINGKLTLGENIADFGGLTIAYYAYQKSLEGKERKEIDGYSPEERFFIAFGQVWKGNYTEEALRQQIATNPHSPNKYRVLGTLSLMPEFIETFGCKDGDAMHRVDSLRPLIW